MELIELLKRLEQLCPEHTAIADMVFSFGAWYTSDIVGYENLVAENLRRLVSAVRPLGTDWYIEVELKPDGQDEITAICDSPDGLYSFTGKSEAEALAWVLVEVLEDQRAKVEAACVGNQT